MPTYKEYEDFCQKLSDTGVALYNVEKACENISDLNEQFVIIKHDVEDKLKKSLKLSKIENSFGITATYYVHSFFLRKPKNVAVLKEIASLGHKIGYHYDVLDNNDGDKNNAIKEFREALTCFADKGFAIKTVCPHGNPLKKRLDYSGNTDFFRDGEISKLFDNIIDVDSTFPGLVNKDYLYITDVKYSYFYRNAKRIKPDIPEESFPLDSTDEIIKMIHDGQAMIISTHSHRFFCSCYTTLLRTFFYKNATLISKFLYKTKWGEYLINKFYFLARKI